MKAVKFENKFHLRLISIYMYVYIDIGNSLEQVYLPHLCAYQSVHPYEYSLSFKIKSFDVLGSLLLYCPSGAISGFCLILRD